MIQNVSNFSSVQLPISPVSLRDLAKKQMSLVSSPKLESTREQSKRAEAFFTALSSKWVTTPQNTGTMRELPPLKQILDRVRREKNELIQTAMVKKDGYFKRLFSSESWEQWTESATDLGKVISLFAEYLQGSTRLSNYVNRLDSAVISRANREAEQLLGKLNVDKKEGAAASILAIDSAFELSHAMVIEASELAVSTRPQINSLVVDFPRWSVPVSTLSAPLMALGLASQHHYGSMLPIAATTLFLGLPKVEANEDFIKGIDHVLKFSGPIATLAGIAAPELSAGIFLVRSIINQGSPSTIDFEALINHFGKIVDGVVVKAISNNEKQKFKSRLMATINLVKEKWLGIESYFQQDNPKIDVIKTDVQIIKNELDKAVHLMQEGYLEGHKLELFGMYMVASTMRANIYILHQRLFGVSNVKLLEGFHRQANKFCEDVLQIWEKVNESRFSDIQKEKLTMTLTENGKPNFPVYNIPFPHPGWAWHGSCDFDQEPGFDYTEEPCFRFSGHPERNDYRGYTKGFYMFEDQKIEGCWMFSARRHYPSYNYKIGQFKDGRPKYSLNSRYENHSRDEPTDIRFLRMAHVKEEFEKFRDKTEQFLSDLEKIKDVAVQLDQNLEIGKDEL